MDILILLTVFQMVSLVGSYEFICPSQAHWNLRAKSMCNPTTNYTCLFDINLQINVFRDRCYRPSIVGPGYKYVFQPNLNRAACSGNRYQPFIFETVGYSDCTFQKSLCNSLGQETYENSNTRSDTTCICNTDKGYTFVRNSNNQCYCNPSTDDCSCYLGVNPYNTTAGLEDIQCYDDMKMSKSLYTEDMFNVSQTIKIIEFDNYKYNLNDHLSNEYRIEAAKCVFILPLAYIVVWIVVVRIIRRWIQARSTPRKIDIVDWTDCSMTIAWFMDVPDECLSYQLDHQPPGKNNLPVMTFSSKDVMEDVNGRRMYTLKNLLPETKYAFKLRSIYKDAKSHYSDLKTKQTLKEAPRKFNIIDWTDCSMTIEWFMKVPHESILYELDHRPPGIDNLPVRTFSSKDVEEDVNGRRFYTLKNLLPETKYAFKLRYSYKDAKSHYSDSKTKQTLKEAPRNFDIIDWTDCSMTIEWFMNVPYESISYELDHRPPGIDNLPVRTFSSKDVKEDVNGRRFYTLKNLLPETKYAFKLRYSYKDAKSHYSDSKTKQTLKEALPEAIRKLSEEDKARYNKLLQSEISEKRYFVRVMIVGKETVGKTCLVRRLLKEKISDVTSTDGVDIVVRRCKINIEDGEWTIGKEINDDKVGRIKRAQNQKAERKNFQHMQLKTKNINKSHSVDMSTDEKDTTTDAEVNMDKSDDKKESPLVIHKDLASVAKVNIDEKENTNKSSSSVMSKNLVSNTQIGIDKKEDTKKSESLLIPGNLVIGTKVGLQINEDTNESSLVMPEDLMSNVFSKSAENTLSNLYALCELWDFAGQKEFYATHQAFLSSSAVYLVVADMKDDISKQGLSQCFVDFSHIGEYVDFWFDSIHCHRTADLQTNNEHFDPPILLVFTGKDKYNNEAEFKKREKELHDQINNVFGYQSKFHHLHQKFYLSNTIDTDDVFAKLRYAISESAQKMENWGNAFPLKWVLLEHLIEINKNHGNHFINFTDMTKLAKHREIDIIDTEELLLFLRFQHNVGNIMFFEDIRDLIILKPQWLSDAFRCLVSDRLDNSSLHHREDWTLFQKQGKISESLITELFKSKDGSQFSGQNKNLNKVMEKLDIIVKIKGSMYYIMPSMMPSSTFDEVSQLFGILNEKCKKTSWLCFKFKFLPPSFFNHISAWFIRKYNPSKIKSGFALYRGICMLDIDGSGCEKILVTMSTDIIALQIVSFSERTEGFGNICSDIYSEVGQFIEDMKERYNVKISVKLNFKCSNGDYYENTFEYSTLKTIQECYCQQHRTAHRSEQIYLPWMKAEVENIRDHRATNRRKQENLNSNNSNAVNISETKEAMNERLDNYVIQQCSTTEPDGSSNAVNISETEEDIGDLPHNSVNQQCSTTEPDDNSNAVNIFETKEEIDVLPGYSVNQQSSATESDGVSNANNIIEKEEEMGKPPDISTKQKCSTTEPEEITSTTEEVIVQTCLKNNLPVSANLRQKLKIKKHFWNKNPRIASCIKIGNTLVFTDYDNNQLIICNSDDTDIHHIPLSYKPRYITEIDSNTVAVYCDDWTILIINISTRSITSTINTSTINTSTINTNGYCGGISYNDNNLYVVIGGIIIHVMDLSGKVIRTIPTPSNRITDITVDRDRLVCINYTSLYCCSLDGKLMWKFKMDEDLRRVTTDNEGNVYVTTYRPNNVVVVSDDGKHQRELLTESDGLDTSFGIYFDKKENILLVCKKINGNAFLFDVKYQHK